MEQSDTTVPSQAERTVPTNNHTIPKQSTRVLIRKDYVDDTKFPSLSTLCRNVITTHLERYPPEAFGLVDANEWQTLMQWRCNRTRPRQGDGGLDGTGRLVPAVSDKFLRLVEEANPHLELVEGVDELLWKACVEYKFPRGSLTRPPILQMPWPQRVEELRQAAETLFNIASVNTRSQEQQQEWQNAIDIIQRTPMNVALLRDSGVGKHIKKCIKRLNQSCLNSNERNDWEHQLGELLASWKAIAANSGVAVTGAVNSAIQQRPEEKTNTEELECAEQCLTWRQLFATLKERNEKRLSTQGKRMREKRRNLAQSRPKLVKVRPSASSQQQQRLLEGSASNRNNNNNNCNSKIALLRKTTNTTLRKSAKASFGDAVAFATPSRKRAKQQQLSGNKRMKVPVISQRGLFASKWKSTK